MALIAMAISIQTFADKTPATPDRSRRSSLCSILVKHSADKYADEIEEQFSQIPISERFNDHNLSVRTVSTTQKKVQDSDLKSFIDKNQIASRLVAKWFDRNILTGECTLDTVKARGRYDATAFDIEMANRSTLGQAMLEDAGEDLIGNTYLLLNDVTYIDKNKKARTWALVGAIAMGALMAAGGASAGDINKTMNNTADIISSYKGFAVKIRTKLYRLVWDNNVSVPFYTEAYAVAPDEAKKEAFEKMRSNFKLEYMGEVTSKGGRTSFLGINEEEPVLMIRKACARAIDENIVDLQHKFEPFRIKTPISAVTPEVTAPIGKKEGITAASKFEVLEIVEKNGKTSYKRVATVKPVATKIWDNRFMADKEGSGSSKLGETTFVKTSGGDIYPGMLLREID